MSDSRERADSHERTKSHERVQLSIENGIANVRLNRPDKLNAIDMEMFRALDKISRELKNHSKLRVVIVAGNGPDFCSGLDVKNVLSKAGNAAKLLFKWLPGQSNLAQRVSTNWRKLSVPVIMALHGRCWGGGMQIALGGDFRIASPDCSLSVMENRWGLIPDMGGTLALRETMALDHAMELAMTAEEITAAQALEWGLVSHIADDPMQQAQVLAKQLINRNPDTIALIKKTYQQAWHRDDRKLLARETLSQIKILRGKNQRIAVARETHTPDKAWL